MYTTNKPQKLLSMIILYVLLLLTVTDSSQSHSSTKKITEELKFRHGDEMCPPHASVSMETDRKEEDDKEQLVFEMVHMYNRQQEKLNATLHLQRELETVRLSDRHTHAHTHETL